MPLLAVIYGSGYIVVSIYHASLGLSEVNPLRPKVAAAGLLFLVFSLLALYLMTFIGAETLGQAKNLSPLHRWFFLVCVGGLRLYCADAVVSFTFMLVFHFEGAQEYTLPYTALVISSNAVLAALIACPFERVRRVMFHWIFLALSGLATVALLAMSFPYQGQFGIRQFASYLFIIQFASVGVGRYFLASKDRETPSWLSIAIQLLIPVVFYGAQVYPHIRSAFGGGDPAPAQIQLELRNELKAVRIIDETDAGFYVLQDNEKSVTYLPRGAVGSIKFDQQANRWPF